MYWWSKKPYLAPLFSLVFAICVLWVLALQVAESYKAEVNRANLEIENISFAVEQELLATFREIELAQKITVEQIEHNTLFGNPSQSSIAKASESLGRNLKHLPTINAIGIINPAGIPIAIASINNYTDKSNYSALFKTILNKINNQSPIVITAPSKEKTLFITSKIKNEEHSTATLFATIPEATIKKILTRFSNNNALAILDRDSNLFSQISENPLNPFNTTQIHDFLKSNQADKTFTTYTNNSTVQTSIRRIGNSSLFVITTNYNSNYLSTWKRTTLIYVLGCFLMLGLSLLMIFYFLRSQRLNQSLVQKENKLIASETRFRQMIETMPIGLMLARMPDFLIMYINQPAAQTLNMPQATALSKRAFEFYSDKNEFTQQVNQVLELKTPQNIECILKKNTHELFWGRISISMVHVADMQTLVIGMIDISEQKKLESELKHQATIDALSGLFNRAHFIYSAGNEIQRIQRHKRSASLLMLDIDHFKRVNDNYGHDAGDFVIQTIALTCKNVMRDIDILGRLGGEEFAVLLPETTLEVALQVAERLRSAIEHSRIKLNDGQIIQITSSIGVTEVTYQDELIDIPLKRADLAMYTSKHNGRNQVRSDNDLAQ